MTIGVAMQFIYTGLVILMGAGIRLAAIFSRKARYWVQGRRRLLPRLQQALDPRRRWIWFHAASLGEFEQGRPLIELIRARHPEFGILLTFYSPSGYLVRKDYAGADVITYMPLDTPANAKRFVRVVQPSCAIFIKYEIWYHHLRALRQADIPTYLISANLRPDQVYFKPWGKFVLNELLALQGIFTQTQEGAEVLRARGFRHIRQAGDTRLDRVLDIANEKRDLSWLSDCLPEAHLVVAGSTWPDDESRLIPALLEAGFPAIIAPHEIEDRRINAILGQLPEAATRLSELKRVPRPVRYVVVDTMGDLAYLFALGNVSYIGGGFGSGIHNVLEPVAHHLPVVIGPRYVAYAEAVILEKLGVIKVITTSESCGDALLYFNKPEVRSDVHVAIQQYIDQNRGATEKIYSVLVEECLGFKA